MKSVKTEKGNIKIWLNPGLMLSVDDNTDLSAIMYRNGIFRKWKIVDESTSLEDLLLVQTKLMESVNKSFRIVGGVIEDFKVPVYGAWARGEVRRLLILMKKKSKF